MGTIKVYSRSNVSGNPYLWRQLIDAGALQSDPAGLKARGQK